MPAQTAGPGGTRVHRTRRTMADGRELLYYDDLGHRVPPRTAADHRELPGRPPAHEMRRDPLTGDWIAMAANRMERTFLPSRAECPLCPTRDPALPTEIAEPSYDVVVFENRFPSFGGLPDGEPPAAGPDPGPAASRPAVGRCEVVSFSDDHDAAFIDLPPARVRTIIDTWADRTAVLSARADVEQVYPFENRGTEIGVTLSHPHGQIYGYPFVTPRTEALLAQAARHRARTGGNLLRDVLHHEQGAGTRIVLRGEHWTAYVPSAARWPVEVHLAPHADRADLAELTDAERDELTACYPRLLRGLDRYHEGVADLPYIAAWHQAPVRDRRALGRLHLQLFSLRRAPDKLKYLAGSESGMAAWINDTTPETIAARLRETAR